MSFSFLRRAKTRGLSGGVNSCVLFLFLGATGFAQTITEFSVPGAGLPTRVIAGPDGNLWFIHWLDGPDAIGRMTTTGSVIEFPIDLGPAYPNEIANGPDGNLWFTQTDIDGTNSAVSRITPLGVLTRFPFSPEFADPAGITVGADGNLWVTLSGAIARVTTGGELATFPTLTFNSRPTGITAGPDGNVWFTDIAGYIGRITPVGVITEFPVPTPASEPYGITVGPDGNLWFTERSANNIGRITPEGVVVEFPVPTRGSEIATGPDGNIWFTSGAKLGRITTSGVVTEIPIHSTAYGVTAGPDRNVWFTQHGRVVRLTLQTAPPIASRLLPVVGSTTGVGGSFFRTAIQLHNPTSWPMAGRVVFHPSGLSGADLDPSVPYSLEAGQTRSIHDLLPAMGRSGLGSADIEVTSGAVPVATVRVFNDNGAAGTTGFTEEPMRAEDALQAGGPGVLLIPADLTRFRFNLGVRTLDDGATATLTVRDAAGAVLETVPVSFPPTYHEQQSASLFLGVTTLPAGGSVTIAVTAGGALFYGATVDNTTGDPSLQVATPAP